MDRINKLSNNFNFTTSKTEDIQQRAFQEQKPDSVEIKNNKKKNIRNVAIGLAALYLVGAAATLIYAVGRNPAKAAKVLKGTDKILDKAYEKGQKLAEDILSKKEGVSLKEEVLKLFEQPKHKSELGKSLEKLDTYMAEKGIAQDSELAKASKRLKESLNSYYEKSEELLNKGKTLDMNAGEKFASANAEDIRIIHEGIDFRNYDLKSEFSSTMAKNKCDYIESIKDCPAEILPNDGIFFHGTKKSRGVYKSGFTPFVSNQLSSSGRELGAGVYVTPDVRVAASFSGLHGSIIPVKLENDARVAFVSPNAHKDLHANLNQLLNKYINPEEYKALPSDVKNAFHECLLRQAFKDAGYDAAYIPKGVSAGGGILGNIFRQDINEVIGKEQTQLVVFSPEKLEIVPRTLKERIFDLKDKFDGLKAVFKYQKEHPWGF